MWLVREFEAALAKLQRVPNDVALVRHIQDSAAGPHEVLPSGICGGRYCACAGKR